MSAAITQEIYEALQEENYSLVEECMRDYAEDAKFMDLLYYEISKNDNYFKSPNDKDSSSETQRQITVFKYFDFGRQIQYLHNKVKDNITVEHIDILKNVGFERCAEDSYLGGILWRLLYKERFELIDYIENKYNYNFFNNEYTDMPFFHSFKEHEYQFSLLPKEPILKLEHLMLFYPTQAKYDYLSKKGYIPLIDKEQAGKLVEQIFDNFTYRLMSHMKIETKIGIVEKSLNIYFIWKSYHDLNIKINTHEENKVKPNKI